MLARKESSIRARKRLGISNPARPFSSSTQSPKPLSAKAQAKLKKELETSEIHQQNGEERGKEPGLPSVVTKRKRRTKAERAADAEITLRRKQLDEEEKELEAAELHAQNCGECRKQRFIYTRLPHCAKLTTLEAIALAERVYPSPVKGQPVVVNRHLYDEPLEEAEKEEDGAED